MPGTVRTGLIQTTLAGSTEQPIETIKKAMIDKHVGMIADAAKKGVKILCMQELFYGPYFCAEQKTKWYSLVERVPDGPTVKLMQELAKKHSMVIIVRGRNSRSILQHRRRHRCGWKISRQVPQDTHPALRSRILGEILLQAGQSRLPDIPDRVRTHRRLYLL